MTAAEGLDAMTHYPIWFGISSFRRVSAARLLLFLGVGLLLPYWLARHGHGVLGLLVSVLGVWQYPVRCRAEADGLRFSWLLLREHVPWRDVERCELMSDGRWRGRFVQITRRKAPSITLRGGRGRLQLLVKDIQSRLLVGFGRDEA